MSTLTRRHFVTGVATASMASAAVAGIAIADEATGCTYADTIAWDGEYDVLVMGTGAAGSSAAYHAAKQGASVLYFDAAPEWFSGGNTRYCGQLVAFGDDKDALMDYWTAFYGNHEVPTEILDVWTDAQADMVNYLVDNFECDPDLITSWRDQYGGAEYPEHPGAETFNVLTLHPGIGDSFLFRHLRNLVYSCSDQVDVWFDARGTKLIQDPVSKTVIGMEIEKDGETRKIRALNGVVMACGGFENDSEMLGDYLGIPNGRAIGTVWNRGDGHKMAAEVGAKMWHMEAYETYPAWTVCVDIDPTYNEHAMNPIGGAVRPTGFSSGSFVLVGKDGTRFLNEVGEARHGHRYFHGEWVVMPLTSKSYLVFDQAHMGSLANYRFNDGALEALVSADTLEELAGKLDIDADVLAKTVAQYNSFAENGEDIVFGRNPETMAPFADGPYYAFPMIPSVLNTQGGPKKTRRPRCSTCTSSPSRTCTASVSSAASWRATTRAARTSARAWSSAASPASTPQPPRTRCPRSTRSPSRRTSCTPSAAAAPRFRRYASTTWPKTSMWAAPKSPWPATWTSR